MKKILIAALATAAFSTPAMAQFNQANVADVSTTSSQGDVQFTTTVPELVRVSGLQDITLDITEQMLNGGYSSRFDGNTRFCVYSNITAAGNYTISLTAGAATAGLVGGGSYALTGGHEGTGKIRYNVWMTDDTNAFKANMWLGNKPRFSSAAYSGTRPATTDCGGQTNTEMTVGVDQAAILAATAGTYKDTITVTVSVI